MPVRTHILCADEQREERRRRDRDRDRETEEHVDPVFIRQRELRVEYADNTAFLLDIRVSSTDRAVIFLHFVRALFKAISHPRAKLISFLPVCSSCCFERVNASDIFFTNERFIYTRVETVCLFGQRTVYSVDKYSNICRYLSSVWYGRF